MSAVRAARASLIAEMRCESSGLGGGASGFQIGLEGFVQEFKYTSPHTFILLAVKAQDGSITVWNLEGVTPSALAREGWSSKSLKAGDELKMTIAPLRSGAPGGAWTPQGTRFRDGKEIVISP